MARIALIVSLLTALLALFGFFQWAWAEWKAHRVRKKMMWLAVVVLLLVPGPAWSTLWYVDGTASGANNGTSWTDAWTTRVAITGLSAGDTVYFSGGAGGQAYDSAAGWQPPSGTAGNVITFAVGQEAGKNGMVTFNATGPRVGAYAFWDLSSRSYITLNGEVSGQIKMTLAGYDHICYTQSADDKHARFLYITWTQANFKCYGSYMELAYSDATEVTQYGNDSMIEEFGTTAGAGGYGINSLHHNIFRLPRKSATAAEGLGFDAIQWISNADIYNNQFLSYVTGTYTGNQHADAIQTGSQYLRIYNNYFENWLNYAIYLEWGIVADCVDHHDFQIYNNVFKTDDAVIADWGSYGVVAGSHVSCPSNNISNFLVANNTFIGKHASQGGQRAGNINEPAMHPFGTGVYVVNNLYYDVTAAIQINATSGSWTESNNSDIGTTNKAFVNNVLSPSGDFHLTSAATAAINAAITPPPSYLTSVYTTDAGGTARADIWEIGAYDFLATAATPYAIVMRKLIWFEVASMVVVAGKIMWYFRQALVVGAMACIGMTSSLGISTWQSGKQLTKQTTLVVLTTFNRITKPRE